MQVTRRLIEGKFGGTEIWIDNLRLPVIFTHATDSAAIDRYVAYIQARADRFHDMATQYEAKREWNSANLGRGRAWPIFTALEREMKLAQREAGIIDT